EYAPFQILKHKSNYFFNVHFEEDEMIKSVLYQLNEKGSIIDSLFLGGYYRLPVIHNDLIYVFSHEKKDTISVLKINSMDLSVQDKREVISKMNWGFIFSGGYFGYCNCFTIVGKAVDSN